MSLLQSIVTQVVQNAITGGQPQQQAQQGGLGGLLGGLTGGNNNSGLGGMLGNVVAGQVAKQMGGQSNTGGLGGMLGGLLGGQQKTTSAGDLGSILGSVLGSQSQQQSQSGGFNKGVLLLALLPIVLGFIQSNGGLSGVLAKFSGNGLDNKAQSWVNIDTDNDGLDAGDVLGLFGQDAINQACQQTGANQDQVCQGIAELLPQVVDGLTPQGNLQTEQQANDEISEILAQFKKAF